MSKHLFFKYGLFLLALSFMACKATPEASDLSLETKSDAFILGKLEENSFKFDHLSTKASVVYNNGGRTGFKINTRIRKDSAIWVSIRKINLEVARVLITEDTVKVINNHEKNYFVGDFSYINNLLNEEVDFYMLQALLIGNHMEFDTDEKIRATTDRKKNAYYISSVKKRKLKKALRRDDKDKIHKEVQTVWMDPENFKITTIQLKNFNTDQSLYGTFGDFKDVNGQLFPHNIHFNLNYDKDIWLEVSYSKVTIEEDPTKLSFSIPKKYEQVFY